MLNWKILLIVFIITVVSELGCFFRNIALIEHYNNPKIVVLGTMAGYTVITIASYFVGGWVKDNVHHYLIRYMPGAFLIFVGIWMLIIDR